MKATRVMQKASEQSFYVVGGTLPANAPSYIERKADYELLTALQQNEYCYILDARQVGKSTLVAHAAKSLKAEGVHVARLDLSGYGSVVSPEQWYFTLLEDLGAEIGLEDELTEFWDEHQASTPLHRWMQALEKVALPQLSGYLIIFMDEVDSIISPVQAAQDSPTPSSKFYPGDEFFTAIRACYNRRAQNPQLCRLTFCLVGSATPGSLIADPERTPFNIARRIEPTDFTLEEALPLAEHLGIEDQEARKSVLRRVLYWTGGHPYLTQALCRAIATRSDALPVTPQTVDRLCETYFFAKNPVESQHLSYIGERALWKSEQAVAVLDLYHTVRLERHQIAFNAKNPAHETLRLSGLVKVGDGYLHVRNRIYAQVFDRQWIRDKMPGAELQQRATVIRKAVARVATAAGVIILLLLGLTYKAFSEANRADQNAMQAKLKEQEASTNAEQARSALAAMQEARNSAQQAHMVLASAEVAQFKTALEQTINAKGVDAPHSTLHFAILMNTVRIAEPGDQWMRDIYKDMLNNYLVSDKDVADYVSFFPFQNEIWQDLQQLPEPFTRSLADQMLTTKPMQSNDKELGGGHNIEKAILDALAVIANTDNGKLLPSTVLIVLSDSEASSPPKGALDYRQEPNRTEFNTKLTGYHVSLAKTDHIIKDLLTPEGKAYTAALNYRIYLSDTLRPLGALSKSRPEINAQIASLSIRSPNPSSMPKPRPDALSFPDWIVPTGSVAILVLLGIGYILWVNKPRGVIINEMILTVSRSKPLYLGGEEAGRNVIALAGLPRGEKVAQLLVNGQGQVILRDAEMYKVGRGRARGPVIIGPSSKTIVVTNKRPDGERYELRVRIM